MAQQGERKEGIKREGRKAKRGEGGREEEVGGGGNATRHSPEAPFAG